MTSLDTTLSKAIVSLRWAPVTPVMQLLSAWWVKSLGFLLIAFAVDRLLARRRWPWLTGATAVALIAASLLSSLVKGWVRRPRPPLGHSGITAIGTLPHGWSFPSGHATEAFAAACVIVWLGRSPPVSRGAVVLACAIAVSRVYLGMHYLGDVLAGALLGGAIALAVTYAIRTLGGSRWISVKEGA